MTRHWADNLLDGPKIFASFKILKKAEGPEPRWFIPGDARHSANPRKTETWGVLRDAIQLKGEVQRTAVALGAEIEPGIRIGGVSLYGRLPISAEEIYEAQRHGRLPEDDRAPIADWVLDATVALDSFATQSDRGIDILFKYRADDPALGPLTSPDRVGECADRQGVELGIANEFWDLYSGAALPEFDSRINLIELGEIERLAREAGVPLVLRAASASPPKPPKPPKPAKQRRIKPAAEPEPEPQVAPDTDADRIYTVTLFPDVHATRAERRSMTPGELAKLVCDANVNTTSGEDIEAAKRKLPLLKLAVFGKASTGNGSLRHNANVISITGIEADYDAGVVPLEEAREKLDKAGIHGLVYTSPRYSPGKPRWRVLCPFSAELPPGDRDPMLARLNGVLGGILAPESFTLSQAYYYGSIDSNPDHRVEIVDGMTTIDRADDLDRIAIGKPNGRGADRGDHADEPRERSDPEAPIEDIAAALDAIPNDDRPYDGKGGWNYVGMAAWRASAGSEEGFAAFDAWSGKSAKYNLKETARQRWDHYHRSPPSDLGFGTLVFLAREADPGWTAPSRRRPPVDDGGEEAGLPQIQVEQGKRHDAADAGIAALVAAKVPVYRRGAQIVHVVRIPAKASDGRTILVPGIMPVPLALLMRELGKAANWLKYDGRSKKLVPIDPPNDVASQIMTMVDEWPFAPLLGVVGTPTLRPDGSIFDQPGYDKATGLVLFDPPAMPAIGDRPSRADAAAALRLLDRLLDEFPFAENAAASRSVALSMLMTPVLRGATNPVVPLHVVKAPAGGTGKSFLADIASAIATGEICPVLSRAPHNEETEKRLHGAALSGQPIISIDNCNGELRSAFLCQAIERPLLQIRTLGGSDLARIGNNTTCFANGNNIEIAEDLVRRTLQCALDANMERPELRTFKRNPLTAVFADRGRYVAAILTIARAYVCAGMPNRPATFMSFDRWSDLVRGSLIWLGCADPVDTVATLSVADPVREDRVAVYRAIAALPGAHTGLKTSELIGAAAERPELREVLAAVAGEDRDGINSRRLGRWLRRSTNVAAGGYKLFRNDVDPSRPRWSVRQL
jgi:hypothetical protein